MSTIGTYFRIIQGHQITDEELYKTEGNIPVYTGGNEVKGYWNESLVSQKDLPCITYPTKGNVDGNAYIQIELFDANNTAVLIPKDEWREKINLEWFVFKLKHIFQDIQTSKENVSYLNKELVEPYEIEIPKMEIQLEQLEPLKKLVTLRGKLQEAIEKVDNLLKKSIVYE